MNIALTDDWDLWRDFAVRSSGFPVEGLEAFGAGEDARLAEVARDPAFREAVAWQSRESLTRAVDKLANGAAGSPSRARRWTDVVSSYWQRYCSKNDTIGFFGPLAWGTFGDELSFRSGALERERVVHFETWAIEAVASAAGIDTPLPRGPFPERALRPLLSDPSGLDRLEVAREAVAAAPRTGVAAALDELDRVFEAVTGRAAARGEGDSGGGRTVAYLDCMRELDLTLGPAVLDELRDSLPAVLYASRWWSGRVFDRGAELLGRLAAGRSGPLAPMLGQLMGAGFGLWNQMGDEQAELQRRWASVVAGTVSARDAFSDWTPAWYGSAYQSADLQIAAADVDAIERGDFLVVLGDFHGGDNPLAQGLFGLRHPDPVELLRRIAAEAGPGIHLSPPRRGVVEMTARSWPMYPEGDVVVVDGDEPAHATRRARGRRRLRRARVQWDVHHAAGRLPLPADLRRRAAQLRPGHPSRRAARPTRTPGGPARHLVGSGERAGRRSRRLGPRPRPPTARVRALAAGAQAALRRLREPVAVPRADPLRRPRGRRAGRVHGDAPRPRRLLAHERRRPPYERAARDRARSLTNPVIRAYDVAQCAFPS